MLLPLPEIQTMKQNIEFTEILQNLLDEQSLTSEKRRAADNCSLSPTAGRFGGGSAGVPRQEIHYGSSQSPAVCRRHSSKSHQSPRHGTTSHWSKRPQRGSGHSIQHTSHLKAYRDSLDASVGISMFVKHCRMLHHVLSLSVNASMERHPKCASNPIALFRCHTYLLIWITCSLS